MEWKCEPKTATNKNLRKSPCLWWREMALDFIVIPLICSSSLLSRYLSWEMNTLAIITQQLELRIIILLLPSMNFKTYTHTFPASRFEIMPLLATKQSARVVLPAKMWKAQYGISYLFLYIFPQAPVLYLFYESQQIFIRVGYFPLKILLVFVSFVLSLLNLLPTISNRLLYYWEPWTRRQHH